VSGAMHVVTNRVRHGEREYTSTLLRRSYREGGKVKKETLANLSHLPPELIELVRGALRGQRYLPADQAFEIERSLPAGHVQAALAMARRLGLGRLLDRQPSRERDLCLAMICQRALAPASKLATVRLLDQSTLASELGVAGTDEDDLYAALDWLGARQARIEERLARRHLRDGELVLYDVSSSYFEGRSCPLARLGYSRDGRRGTPQIIYGLLCDKPGRPVCVEVFSGELHDDKTLPSQVAKLKTRFGLETLVVVSDRGMVTKANLELLRATEGAGWITALKAPQIKKLVREGALQLSLFDQHNLAEITADDYPGERLIVCRNPLVAAERARKREDLLAATERGLREIVARVEQRTLRGAAEIGLAVGPAAKRYRMRKHFPARDHRHQLRLRPQDRPDRRRGRTRRHLRLAHQPDRREAADRRRRPLLQATRAGRARLQNLQGSRARDPPDPPPPRPARPRPRLPLHARLLPHLAPAASVGAAALQRRAATRPGRPGRQSTTLARRPTQSRQQTHRRR